MEPKVIAYQVFVNNLCQINALRDQLGNIYLVTPSASNYFEGLEKENVCTLMIVRNPRGEIKGVISDEST